MGGFQESAQAESPRRYVALLFNGSWNKDNSAKSCKILEVDWLQ